MKLQMTSRIFMVLLTGLVCIPNMMRSQIQDTVHIDLNQLNQFYLANVQHVEIPVYFNGATADVNAIDFWFMFNTTKYTYIETLSEQAEADAFSNFNTENLYLSNTTSSSGNEAFFAAETPLLTLHFQLNDPCAEVLVSDFSNGQALVNGLEAAIQWSVPAPSNASIAVLTAAPYCVLSPIEMTFQDAINGQAITAYSWDLAGSLGNTQTVEAVYPSAGSYAPQLAITTEAGCQLNFSADISVSPAPAVSFDWTGTQVSEATVFNNTSTFSDGTITGYDWTFGDNGTSTDANPSHTYATEGLFNITLTATGDNGCSASATQEISITSSVENLQAPAIRVYPNPATEEVYIVNEMNQVVELYNALGQKIDRTFLTVSNEVVKMNVSDLAPGMYQLAIQGKTSKKSTTLLID